MAGERDLFATVDEAREARRSADAGNPFADARSIAGDQAKRRGRPKGALNVKTKDFERYYGAMGYRDPLQAMAQWLTADPVELQAWFEAHETTKVALGKGAVLAVPSLLDIIREQHSVAVALAPYLHGKKPVQVEIIDERLPALIIDLGTNQLAEAGKIVEAKALSIAADADPSAGEKVNEINGGHDDASR